MWLSSKAIDFEGGRKEEIEKDDKQPEKVKVERPDKLSNRKFKTGKEPSKPEDVFGAHNMGKRFKNSKAWDLSFLGKGWNMTTAKNAAKILRVSNESPKATKKRAQYPN